MAGLERVQANLKRYRASVLKAAVEGRLVPTEAELARAEGRDYEPASVLLERILTDRRQRWERAELAKMQAKGKTPKSDKWKAKYKEPAAPDTSNLPSLPEGWCWATIEQLLREPLRNGHSAPRAKSAHGLPVLSLSAVTTGDFSKKNLKITNADPNKVNDLWIQPGDIFVQRSNTPELVGTARLFSGTPGLAFFPDLLIRIRVIEWIKPEYVEIGLQSSRTRTHLRKAARGIAGSMPKISQDTIANLGLPIAPAAEQVRICDEVMRLTSLGAKSKEVVVSSRRRAHLLRQSILKWAFEGKLVDQDPADEPASELLARIRAQREAQAAKSQPKRRKPRKKKTTST